MSQDDRWTPEGLRLMNNLKELQSLEVRIGFEQGKSFNSENVDILDYAMFNELGTSRAPSRPFMRKSVDENSAEINTFIKGIQGELANGTPAETILKKIGVFQKGLIQDKIESGSYTPNAPSTIAKKGSSKPLIDKGDMRRAVNFVIKKKGS